LVLYPAKVKDGLDWETINKLCDQNTDFKKFVEDVKIDFDSKRIHRAEYDDIPKDPSTFISERLKIEPLSGLRCQEDRRVHRAEGGWPSVTQPVKRCGQASAADLISVAGHSL